MVMQTKPGPEWDSLLLPQVLARIEVCKTSFYLLSSSQGSRGALSEDGAVTTLDSSWTSFSHSEWRREQRSWTLGKGEMPKTKWHTAYGTSSAYIWHGLKSQWHFTLYSTHKLISPYQQRVVGRIKVCLWRLAVSARLSQCKGGEWMWTGNVCVVWTETAGWVKRWAGNSWTCLTGREPPRESFPVMGGGSAEESPYPHPRPELW